MFQNQQYYSKLIDEYKICYEHAYKLESLIWQTASIFGVGSLAGFGLLANIKFKSDLDFFVLTLIISTLAISVSYTWIRFVRRWGSIEGKKFDRLQEIEKDIIVGFRNNLIIDEWDKKTKSYRKSQCCLKKFFRYIPDYIEEMTPENLKKLLEDKKELENYKKYEYRSIASMSVFLPYISISLWIFITLYAALKPMLENYYINHIITSILVIFLIIFIVWFLIFFFQWRKP